MAPDTPAGPIVDISSDGLRITVRGRFTVDTVDQDVQSIAEQLGKFHVCEEARQIDLTALVRQWAEQESEFSTNLLYEGTPPGPATDGRLEWARDFFITGFEVDAERDTVDYRKRLDERSVRADELLCTITEAIDGAPGIDVFGKEIRGPKAKRPRLRLGPNVATPDEREYFATRSGRIRWHRGTLSVDDVYVVDSSVNLRTGNITHPGALVIHGDVERDAVVSADKDVEVRGMIDGGTVDAGGDVVVVGGIVGHEDSRVTARGSIRAAYLLDAHVEAGADLLVAREIVQSRVVAQGGIRVPQGRIVGGVVRAGAEIAAGEIGTGAAVRTAIHVNEPAAVTEERESVERRMADLDQRLAQMNEVTDKLSPRTAALPPGKREALAKLKGQIQTVAQERDACREELEALLEDQTPSDSRSIRVLRRLHAETLLNINGASKKIAYAFDGPVTVRERNGEIRIFAD